MHLHICQKLGNLIRFLIKYPLAKELALQIMILALAIYQKSPCRLP